VNREPVTRPSASCAVCHAWGAFQGRSCNACASFKSKNHQQGTCQGCARRGPVQDDCCRSCWRQARYEAARFAPPGTIAPTATKTLAAILRSGRAGNVEHQLFFDRMERPARRRSGVTAPTRPRGRPRRGPRGPRQRARQRQFFDLRPFTVTYTPKAAASCDSCLAWGTLAGRSLCGACFNFRNRYTAEAPCGSCRRMVPVRVGYCRLCWREATIVWRASGSARSGVQGVLDAGLFHHQLFFDRMDLRRRDQQPEPARPAPIGRPPTFTATFLQRPPSQGVQLQLLTMRREFSRVAEPHHHDLTNPWLHWAQHVAQGRGEARGWSTRIRFSVQHGLTIVLSHHIEGDTIHYSELTPALNDRWISVERVAEVLAEIGVLVDDRPSAFETALNRQLEGLAPGIRHDVEAWQRALHDGGPRTVARARSTVGAYLRSIRPALLTWSATHGHLREVTHDEILEVTTSLHGHRRISTSVALRSLFAFCRKTGTIFRNPTTGIKVGRAPHKVLQRLPPDDVDQAVAAATTPATRLVVALAAIHAARPAAIRALLLDDVELGDHRITVAGRTRPLDDLTHHLVIAWLEERHQRWPNTANPHLLISAQTAMETGPVSHFWATPALGGRKATLDRLRIDRLLEEAIAYGPDPLHLAVVFDLSEPTAIRYAESARQLLTTAAEDFDGLPDR
jgi:hypothetical protein